MGKDEVRSPDSPTGAASVLRAAPGARRREGCREGLPLAPPNVPLDLCLHSSIREVGTHFLGSAPSRNKAEIKENPGDRETVPLGD